jgi:hypothetical protein
MKNSHNVLYIESLDTLLDDDPFSESISYYIKAFVNFKIQFICPVTGNKFKEIELITSGKAKNEMDAFKIAVQSILDGDFYDVYPKTYNVSFDCQPHKGIDHLEMRHLPEQWQNLFREIFDISKYSIEKLQLPK